MTYSNRLTYTYANIVIMVEDNGYGHQCWRQKSYYREGEDRILVHNIKTMSYSSQTVERWQRKEEGEVVWHDT